MALTPYEVHMYVRTYSILHFDNSVVHLYVCMHIPCEVDVA